MSIKGFNQFHNSGRYAIHQAIFPPFLHFLKITPRAANLSNTQNYHPRERKSTKFLAITYPLYAIRYTLYVPPRPTKIKQISLKNTQNSPPEFTPGSTHLVSCRGLSVSLKNSPI